MKIFLHKNFVKKYAKLSANEKQKFKKLRNLFLENPFHSILNNHALKGKYKNCRSINITGDLRAIFEILGEDTVFFIDVDNHSNLYY